MEKLKSLDVNCKNDLFSCNPLIDRVLFDYASIDANGVIILNTLCKDKYGSGLITIKKRLPLNNIYIDKNYFDILIADPVKKAHYYLYNIYYIENSTIYIAGISSILSFENLPSRPIKNLMSSYLLFNWHFDIGANEFVYETNSLYSIKFNPNYFSQIVSFENLEKISRSYKLYSKLCECVPPYDRPSNYMQRSFFMAGVNSVKKYGLDNNSYKEINSYFASSSIKNAADCYFSFEQFYLSGIQAALNFYKMSEVEECGE